MASSTTSSIYRSSMSGKGIGGLVSGLDTDSLVEQMTQTTQTKINRQFQSQQKLVYQQEAYRDIISRLVGFSDKYFSYASKDNILSPSFFKSNTFTPSSGNVSISGDANSIKNFTIDKIDEVASNSRFTSSKKISGTSFESDVVLSTKDVSTLAGQAMSIKYDNQIYTIKIDDNFDGTTLQDVTDELNRAISETTGLDGKVQYKITGNRLELENLDPGSGVDIGIAAVGKGIEEILHIKVNSSGMSDNDIDPSKLFVTKNLTDSFKNGEITFDYNGVQKKLTFTNSNITDAESLKNELQTQLDKAYGRGKITVGTNGGAITFDAGSGNNTFGVSYASQDITLLTGISAGDNNRVDLNASFADSGLSTPLDSLPPGDNYEIKVNGKIFSFGQNATIGDVITKINNDSEVGVTLAYSKTTDSFTVVSKETGSHTAVDIEDVSGNLSQALFGAKGTDYTIQAGTDAKLTVTMNGTTSEIIRSNNSFAIDDISLELSSKAKGETNITFGVTNNADEVVDRISKFIDEYNEIVTYLDFKITEAPERKYPPLTDAQRENMSESQIKLWDEKAKAGMLYCDPKMQGLLGDLRNSMSGFVEGTGMMLANVGITGAERDYSGKLVIDKEKFKTAYLEKPDEIAKIFTQNIKNGSPEELGLAHRVKNILSNNVGFAGEKGILVDHSGTKGTTTANENYLSDRIEEYDETIKNLNLKLKRERERYWNQFTALERALSNMNSQSSWLSSQSQ